MTEEQPLHSTKNNPLRRILLSTRVGLFLGVRQLRRSSKAMSALIVLIMTLTFLNLVVVTGILTGLPHGAKEAYRLHYAGDVLISAPDDKRFLERSQAIRQAVDALPEVAATSARYVTAGRAESIRRDFVEGDDLPDQITAQVAGINPGDENAVTGLERFLVDGAFLQAGDSEGAVISHELLAAYASGAPVFDQTLENVTVGDRLRVTVGGNTRDFILRGVIETKAQVANRRIYVLDTRLREMMQRVDSNVNEIAVRLFDPAIAGVTKETIRSFDTASAAVVELSEESLGQFLSDIEETFTILGSAIGGIGLVVAAITIFIVIFINAVTRRRYIGILKGIGVGGFAIELAYVVQALVYVLIGSAVGLLLTYRVLVPQFMSHPIDFPFSDGILLAPVEETLVRMMLLVLTTIIAGYIPAKVIVRQNTLDAILGR